MFEITRLTVEHLAAGCVTDCSTPRIGFSLSSDRRGAQLADAELTVGDWSAHVTSGQSAAYVGPALLPFTTYSVRLNATDDAGETATATTTADSATSSQTLSLATRALMAGAKPTICAPQLKRQMASSQARLSSVTVAAP